MRKIFISYRRSEAEYAAGALGRELRRHFGDEQIFRDKEDIGGGVAWKDHVLQAIDGDAAVLVLIGRDWANAKDPQGNRRLEAADDPLRIEIADAIRDGAVVLPVLLEDARMPDATELPPELRRLADYNALKLRDGDWAYDLDNIRKTLERSGFKPVAVSPAPQPGPAPPPETKAFGAKAIVGAALVVFALIALGSDDLSSDGHVGALLMCGVSLVLGVMAWRDGKRGHPRARILGIVVTAFSVLGVLAAIGGMDSAPSSSSSAPAPGQEESASPQPQAAPDELNAPARRELTAVQLLKGHAVLQFDPAWRADPSVKTEAGAFQYVHSSGEVFMKVVSERIQIGLEKLAEIGVANVLKVDAAAKTTRRGPRRVNGLDMVFREVEATIDDVPLTFYIHYYSDTAGSIQLVGWTGRSLIGEHRSLIDQFVSGFEVARP